MKKLTKLSLTVLALSLSTAAFAAPKTLVYCLEASPSAFNPQLVTDGPPLMPADKPFITA